MVSDYVGLVYCLNFYLKSEGICVVLTRVTLGYTGLECEE